MNLTAYMANQIITTVDANLHGAQVIAIVPNPRDDIERPGYWERSWIVAWQRPVVEHQPSPGNDGFTHATHRVHVNSIGETACFMGHYDQTRESALADMIERAGIKPTSALDAIIEAVMAMDRTHHVHLSMKDGMVSGIAADRISGTEFDVGQRDGKFYANDDNGVYYYGDTLVEALEEGYRAQ
jgi:hypothetical protein